MSKAIKSYKDSIPYVTKDGSIIRELMHPNQDPVVKQSVAEAIIQVGMATFEHKHLQSEEIYYVIQGQGSMSLGAELFSIKAGDTICIPPNTAHSVKNTGHEDLKIICTSCPAYSHNDTQLVR